MKQGPIYKFDLLSDVGINKASHQGLVLIDDNTLVSPKLIQIISLAGVDSNTTISDFLTMTGSYKEVNTKGDMLKTVYDINDSGVVDNSELVNNLTVETAVPLNAVFTDTTYGAGLGLDLQGDNYVLDANLELIKDVNLQGITVGQILSWNGIDWVPINAASGGGASELEKITEGGQTGWRLLDRDPANYGDTGVEAIDLSYSDSTSNTKGATGDYSLAFGKNNTNPGRVSLILGENNANHGEGAIVSGWRNYNEGAYGTISGAECYNEGAYGTINGYSAHNEGDYSTVSGWGCTNIYDGNYINGFSNYAGRGSGNGIIVGDGIHSNSYDGIIFGMENYSDDYAHIVGGQGINSRGQLGAIFGESTYVDRSSYLFSCGDNNIISKGSAIGSHLTTVKYTSIDNGAELRQNNYQKLVVGQFNEEKPDTMFEVGISRQANSYGNGFNTEDITITLDQLILGPGLYYDNTDHTIKSDGNAKRAVNYTTNPWVRIPNDLFVDGDIIYQKNTNIFKSSSTALAMTKPAYDNSIFNFRKTGGFSYWTNSVPVIIHISGGNVDHDYYITLFNFNVYNQWRHNTDITIHEEIIPAGTVLIDTDIVVKKVVSNNLQRANGLEVYMDGRVHAPEQTIALHDSPRSLVTKEYADGLGGGGGASELEKVTEGGYTGWRILGRDPANYGDIGQDAVDLSYSEEAGTSYGATGHYSFAEGYHTWAENNYSHSEGYRTKTHGEGAHAEGMRTQVLEDACHAEGYGTTADGYAAHTEGYQTTTDEWGAHAEGIYTTSSGYGSHAEGYNTKALGNHSHTEGDNTEAHGWNSHAEGDLSAAYGNDAHAQNYRTTSYSNNSTSTGYWTVSAMENSFTEGLFSTTIPPRLLNSTVAVTKADNSITIPPEDMSKYSVGDYIAFWCKDTNGTRVQRGTITEKDTEGYKLVVAYHNVDTPDRLKYIINITTMSIPDINIPSDPQNAHAEGLVTTATADASHAEGRNTVANGKFSHVEGYYTTANGEAAHAEGYKTLASAPQSHTEGYYTTTASGWEKDIVSVTTSGNNTIIAVPSFGNDFHVDEYATFKNKIDDGWLSAKVLDVSGNNITVEANITTIDETEKVYPGRGSTCHAEGMYTFSYARGAHAEGYRTVAKYKAAHAEGYGSMAIGYGTHAEGYYTTTGGDYAHAEGYGTTASAYYSHAEGSETTASAYHSHAEGLHTIAQNIASHAAGRYNTGTSVDTIHETGIGADDANRANAFEIYTDGRIAMPNIPTTDPVQAGVLWNNSGVLNISAG